MESAVVSGLEQVSLAILYYLSLVLLLRFSGKRLAGQTTTFDLIVLIALGVVLQTTTLKPGLLNAVLFILTVFLIHKGLAMLCARWQGLRYLVRGKPTVLVREGEICWENLRKEGMSEAELLAGLRKQGHLLPHELKLAVLEETGHITSVARRSSE